MSTLKPKWIYPGLLLHPNIPKPLHEVNPRSVKGDSWWNKMRQDAYARNNYCCWACGIHKSQAKYHQWLEAHEAYEIDYASARMYLVKVVALCHACHNYIHSGRMAMMVDSGEMQEAKYLEILDHGHNVLRLLNAKDNPLVKDVPDFIANTIESYSRYTMLKEIPAWESWRMVIDGKDYEPKFKSLAEWVSHYSSPGSKSSDKRETRYSRLNGLHNVRKTG